MDLTGVARVREYRRMTAEDGKAQSIELGLSAEETRRFLSSADSNAIWDAQEGRPYRKPVYVKPASPLPKYTEMGFLSDEEYIRLMGVPRTK
jgi:hypothetical protein